MKWSSRSLGRSLPWLTTIQRYGQATLLQSVHSSFIWSELIVSTLHSICSLRTSRSVENWHFIFPHCSHHSIQQSLCPSHKGVHSKERRVVNPQSNLLWVLYTFPCLCQHSAVCIQLHIGFTQCSVPWIVTRWWLSFYLSFWLWNKGLCTTNPPYISRILLRVNNILFF